MLAKERRVNQDSRFAAHLWAAFGIESQAMRSRAIRALSLLAGLCLAGGADGAQCRPANGNSPCIDANSLWLATGAAHFLSLPEPVALGRGQVGLAVVTQLLFRPLSAELPSPELNGREVRLVERALEADMLLALGLGRRLELGLTLPVILNQRGAGSAGLTSQRAEPIDATAERDPHVSIARAFEFTSTLGAKPRLELALPLGNRSAYASAGSITFAPALPIEFQSGAFTLGLELGLRLRQSVELGTLRWGSQGSASLGLSLALLPRDLLWLAGELLVLPSLINANSERGRALATESRLLPAEWLFSVRSRPRADEPWTLALAAGAGLALSNESSPAGEERFVAPTSPGLRLLAEVRYAPRE